MRYLIFNTLPQAEAINDLIQNFMISNVENYRAERWTDIITNGSKFAISVDESHKNNPINALDDVIKNKLTELDTSWWKTDEYGIKILTFVD